MVRVLDRAREATVHRVVCQLVLSVLWVHEGVIHRHNLYVAAGNGLLVCHETGSGLAVARPTRLAVGIRERRAEDQAADAAEPVCGRAEGGGQTLVIKERSSSFPHCGRTDSQLDAASRGCIGRHFLVAGTCTSVEQERRGVSPFKTTSGNPLSMAAIRLMARVVSSVVTRFKLVCLRGPRLKPSTELKYQSQASADP